MMKISNLLLALVLVIPALAACSSDDSSGTPPKEDAGPGIPDSGDPDQTNPPNPARPCDGLFTAQAPAECKNCANRSCSDQCRDMNAASDDIDATEVCFEGCSDEDMECLLACIEENNDAYWLVLDAIDCIEEDCLVECGGSTGGGTCKIYELSRYPTCEACSEASCLDKCEAATDDPNYNAYVRCWNACSTEQCGQACDGQYPATAALFEAYDACLFEGPCKPMCTVDNNCGIGIVGNTACNSCIDAQCTPECNAVNADEDQFNDWLDCEDACSATDQACSEGCATRFPAAAAWFECVATKCAACGLN